MSRSVQVLFIVVLSLKPCSSLAQERPAEPPIEVTYIANEGFLIAVGQEKVMIDALQKNRYGYASTPDEVVARMTGGLQTFEGVDLMIVSHDHRDHFNADMVCDYLSQRPEVVFVSSSPVVERLTNSSCGGSPEVMERIREVNPDWGATDEVSVPGIRARFLALNHSPPGDEEYLTLGTLLEINGRKVLHLADMDVESTLPYLSGYGLATEDIDIVFLDNYLATDEAGIRLVRDEIKAKHMVVMHVRERRFEEEQARVREFFPDAVFFRSSLEQRIFR